MTLVQVYLHMGGLSHQFHRHEHKLSCMQTVENGDETDFIPKLSCELYC